MKSIEAGDTASPRSCAPVNDQVVIEHTRRWIASFVIGLGLCRLRDGSRRGPNSLRQQPFPRRLAFRWQRPTAGPREPPVFEGNPHLRFAVFAENAEPHYFLAKLNDRHLFEFRRRGVVDFEAVHLEHPDDNP